jgi:dienelactone hydrolase
MAAMGFCFGGLCMLDFARHGTHLRSVAAFHGLLTALPEAPSTPIGTRISVYHGWDGLFAPPADVLALTAELTQRQADWQLHAHGNTVHAFMAPFANSPERGIMFSETASRRAWAGFVEFLDETFAG